MLKYRLITGPLLIALLLGVVFFDDWLDTVTISGFQTAGNCETENICVVGKDCACVPQTQTRKLSTKFGGFSTARISGCGPARWRG